MKKLAVLAALLLSGCETAPAAVVAPDPPKSSSSPSAAELEHRCTINNLDDSWFCTGYMNGVIDTTYHLMVAGNYYNVCLPKEGMSALQLTRMLTNRLMQRPVQMNKAARAVLFDILVRSYPCVPDYVPPPP